VSIIRSYPLELKPDLADAAERYDAFYAGEIIDRPLVQVTAPLRKGVSPWHERSYHDLVLGDMDATLDQVLEQANNTYYGGEAVPSCSLSFAPDAIAVFCGAELRWNEASGDTNWAVPFVERWEDALPLRLNEDHPLWQRQIEFLRLAADRLEGKMLLRTLDWHTNMDLLAAARGRDRLCMDLVEQPEMVDEAMRSARAIFPKIWSAVVEAGKMRERGFCNILYSMEGADILQCDFGAMISPAMFERWALPALEEEASIVKNVYYHWDGPTQLVHEDLLCRSAGIYTIQYQMGAGRGDPIDYLELYKRLQSKGKAVHFWGSPDEIKRAHRELRPEKVLYSTGVGSVEQAESLLDWFSRNT
jgi:5-methyltetrahydrofolate--homocysteine methyltransferase